MSKRFTKGQSLNILEANGMNTPIFRVFRAPFNREEMVSAITDFPEKISIRTWKKDKVECPFYPNHMKFAVPDILETLFAENPQRQLDEIILSQGIDPAQSLRCGRVSHLSQDSTEDFAYLEYFEGPGTVRELDKRNAAETEREAIPRWGWQNPELWKLYLMSKCRPFFRRYPQSTLEWSIYPFNVGVRQDTLIFWEVL